MRESLLISAAIHVALVMVVAIPYQRQTAHGETMQVELVRPDEAPSFNEEPAKPDQPDAQQQQPPQQPKKQEAPPDFSKLQLNPTPSPQEDQSQQKKPATPPPLQAQQQRQAAQQQQQAAQPQQQQSQQARQQQAAQSQPLSAQPSPPQPSPAQSPQAQPANPVQQAQAPAEQELPKVDPEMAVEDLSDQRERLAALMNLPGGANGLSGFGTEAETKAKLAADETAKFKAQLRTCMKMPPGVSENQQVKLVIRIALLPNGTLAAQPSLIEAAASEAGLPLYKNAVAALKQCGPYTMFSADRYKEWRVLDINFSPDVFMRG